MEMGQQRIVSEIHIVERVISDPSMIGYIQGIKEYIVRIDHGKALKANLYVNK